MPTLPPDVAAYLIQAAKDLATETGFIPADERSLRAWMEANRRAIGERALAAMRRLSSKLFSDDRLCSEVCSILAAQVYARIPKQAQTQFQPRFVAYAKSQGMTPEAVLARDGNMTNFICWHP